MTFANIYYCGKIIKETDLFLHYHTAEMLLYYDGNFLQLKKMPSIPEWERAVRYLREFHLAKGQEHVKILFPEGERLPKELHAHLEGEGYELGRMELYTIKPSHFPAIKENQQIKVEVATTENKKSLFELKYEIDSDISEEFARQKQTLHEEHFHNPRFLQLIATFDGNPVGTVDLIISEDTVEIDGLVVLDDYQRRGIGSQLQAFVMRTFAEKLVILVADGDDTPREMYEKQNYLCQGFKYEALKVFS